MVGLILNYAHNNSIYLNVFSCLVWYHLLMHSLLFPFLAACSVHSSSHPDTVQRAVDRLWIFTESFQVSWGFEWLSNCGRGFVYGTQVVSKEVFQFLFMRESQGLHLMWGSKLQNILKNYCYGNICIAVVPWYLLWQIYTTLNENVLGLNMFKSQMLVMISLF